MPDFNLSMQTLVHKMGNCAITDSSVRYISKEVLKSEISLDKFKEYEKIFDYVDKNDNVLFKKDGRIDLASFGDSEYIEDKTSGVCFVGEAFIDGEKLAQKLKISKEKIQNFFNMLFGFQLKRDNYLYNSLYGNIEESKEIMDTKVRNNVDGTQTVIKRFKNNEWHEVTSKGNQILEEVFYDKDDKIIDKTKYKYKNNKIFEKVNYNSNNEINEKIQFLYFQTEADAEKYAEKTESLPDISGISCYEDKGEYVVEITY